MLNSKIQVAKYESVQDVVFLWDAVEIGYYNTSKLFIKNEEQVIFEYFVQRFFLYVSYFQAQVAHIC